MLRSVIGAAVLAIALAVSGCSFSPVYSDGSPMNAASLAFDFGKPNSRLEQVVYNELSLRFAISSAPNTPKLTVTAVPAVRDMAMAQSPGVYRPDGKGNQVFIGRYEPYEVTVTVTAVATLNGKEIYIATRRASAQFTTQEQVLADRNAQQDAEERAAKAAAESLRLALLARFPRNASTVPVN